MIKFITASYQVKSIPKIFTEIAYISVEIYAFSFGSITRKPKALEYYTGNGLNLNFPML